jgi:hypothetical protein
MSSTSVVAAIGHAASTPQGSAIDVFNFDGGRCRTCRQHPQGPAVDVFNFGGGRCRTCRQHSPGGPPSMSSILVVAATVYAASTPQVAHHRRYLALMVGAHGPLAPAPPGGSPRRFLMFMVGAPRSLAPIGPICGITASPEVGPGAFVGTLKTGYPCIQVLSQDKEQGVHPRTAT